MNLAIPKPKILLMGGPDMDLRLDLMGRLKSDFEMMCAGTAAEHSQKFAAAGFKYYPYPLGRTVSPVQDLYSAAYIRRLFLKVRPHVLHTFDAKPGVWGRLVARWVGIPVIIGTLPGLGSLYTKDDLSTRLARAIYQPLQRVASHFSDLTTFQNQDDARQLIAARVVTEQKTLIIPGSGVSTELYAPAQVSDSACMNLRNELGIAPGEIVVTMISRVIRTKGVMEFMAAATEIKSHCPNVHFLLIGPDDQQSLDRLNAAELTQLKQTVSWPGPRRDIPTVLAASDVFVFPSAFREGIPRVLLEAASMGLPLVTTNSPGCNEVVEDGVNGFLVPVRDSAALGEAIVRLIRQPEMRQRFGVVSRQRAVERFDLAIITEQIRSMYQQLLTRHGLLARNKACLDTSLL